MFSLYRSHFALARLFKIIALYKLHSIKFNYCLICVFLKNLFIFRQRGREVEREGEKHQCVVASHMTPTGDVAHNPGVSPEWELNCDPLIRSLALNPLSHTSQGP